MQIVTPSLLAALGDIIATGATFDPAATYLGLATAITNHGITTDMTDVTPPSGALATRKLLAAFTAAYDLENGCVVADANLLTWATASSGDATTIANWYLADALTAGNLLGFGPVTPPAVVPYPGGRFSMVFRITLDPRGQWDASVYWNG
jgi:hypothetical protein